MSKTYAMLGYWECLREHMIIKVSVWHCHVFSDTVGFYENMCYMKTILFLTWSDVENAQKPWILNRNGNIQSFEK